MCIGLKATHWEHTEIEIEPNKTLISNLVQRVSGITFIVHTRCVAGTTFSSITINVKVKRPLVSSVW